MGNTETDVLWENEVNSNKVMVAAALVTAAIYAVIWVLNIAEVFYLSMLGRPHLLYLFIILELCIPSFIAIHYRCEKKWIKYMMMISMILSFTVVDTIFTIYVPFLMVIPIVLASRYFSSIYTIIVTVCTDVAFLISAILGVYYGAADVSCLELPTGTVIQIEMGYNIFSDYVDAGMVQYDKGLMLKNVLLYSYLIKLIFSMIVSIICVLISYQGRRIIFRQKELTENSARIRAELSLATSIQLDKLPNDFPAFPEREEVDIYASYTPAKAVGGDFYDFFFIDEDHLCLVMADVSDKGIPAALFMMSSKIIIADHAAPGKLPSEIMAESNHVICAQNRQELFVTVWLGILELSTGKLTSVNAGHEYPVLRKKDGSFCLIHDDPHNFVLGAIDDIVYTDREMLLSPGDKLFLYTDGLPEATDAGEKSFGEEGMLAALNQDPTASPEQLLKNVRSSVDAFVNGAEQFDDLTMLCLEYKGPRNYC